MKNTITTEYEGIKEQTSLENIIDYLYTMAEVSNGSQDFATKVAYGVTDETSGLETGDMTTLEEWYHRVYLGL